MALIGSFLGLPPLAGATTCPLFAISLVDFKKETMLGATLFCVSITQLYVFESDWKDGAPDGEVRGRTPYEHRSLHTHETDDLAGGNDCRVYFLPVTLVALIGRVAPFL